MQYGSAAASPTAAPVNVATGHAGEILQGALRGMMRTHRLLLSLPAPTLWTQAEVTAIPGRALSVQPAWAEKARRAAQRLCIRLATRPPEVAVRLTTNIPVGKGCGSSTADVLATMRAPHAHSSGSNAPSSNSACAS